MLTVLRIQGLIGLLGPVLFLTGILSGSTALVIVGGSISVLDDVLSILLGVLNPLFPAILAIVLAIALDPWWVGVFWASAGLSVIDIPHNIMKLFRPQVVAARIASKEAVGL